MFYKKFQDNQLSALGMGCMRLPLIEGTKDIDVDAVKQMVALCFKSGINYFDTAWGYHNGNSELVMGEVLADYPRDSYYLASKFPGYDKSLLTKPQEIFEQQLKKCKTDYFDFYLFHNLDEGNVDDYLNPKYGIYDFLMQQKKQGKIKHLGFSTHGTYETTKRFLDAYGKDMEFCQVQLNWIDWEFQDAKSKVKLLNSLNIPIWVMEPLRGGSLCKIDEQYQSTLKELRPDYTLPQWSFNYLQTIEGLGVVLSGMSNIEQLEQNITIFDKPNPLSEKETSVLLNIAKQMTNSKTLPCTSCRYCTTYCPMELDIPWLISLYNEHVYSNGGFLAPSGLRALPPDKRPSMCQNCHKCEEVCPQKIKIAQMMQDFTQLVKI